MNVKSLSALFIASLMAITLVWSSENLKIKKICVGGLTCSCFECPGSCRCAKLKPELEEDSPRRHSRARKASRRSRYNSMEEARQHYHDSEHVDQGNSTCPPCTGCPDCPYACDYVELFPLFLRYPCRDKIPSDKTEKPKRSDIEIDD